MVDRLYYQKEIEYPVMKILGDRIQRDPSGQKFVDREGIAKQGRDRFQASFTEDQFRTMASEDIRTELMKASETWQQRAIYATNATREQLASLPATLTNHDGSVNEAFDKFYQWLRNEHLVVLPTAKNSHTWTARKARTPSHDGRRDALSLRDSPHGADPGLGNLGRGLEEPLAGDGPFAFKCQSPRYAQV